MRTELAAACERALVASARARRAGTRQQRRAAARRFVRRHRRDAGHLRWVLRSVGASSALALALLGLGAQPAAAAGTQFTLRTGAASPFAGVDGQTKPALIDLDADGDLDLAASSYFGIDYYENTGDASEPAFAPRTGTQNPFDGLSLVGLRYHAPALGDLDRDGDFDAIVADYGDVAYRYLENTGTAVAPALVERTGAQNPFAGVPCCAGSPTVGDLDADGDLDLVSGWITDLRYFENTGSAESPAFVERTGSASPVAGLIGYGYFTTPAFGDVDRDGDLDLVVGTYDGTIRYLENTGSAATPHFVSRPNAVDEEIVDYSAPALGDLDADGDLDLAASWIFLSGEDLHYFENRAGEVVAATGDENPLTGLEAGASAAPAFGDLDGNGQADLVSGGQDGTFRYFRKFGFQFLPETGAENPLDGQDVGSRSAPALGDLDGDGDLDLVAGEQAGPFHYFENTGSSTSPAFAARTGSANPADGLGGSHAHTKPALGDLDADGDLDLVAGEQDGALLYFENTGTPANAAFVARTGAGNPLDGVDLGSQSAPVLGDFDGDGDLDLIAGDSGGAFAYLENTGSRVNAAFAPRTGAASPLDGHDVGTHSAPALTDADHDGDLDLAAGESGNAFFYFENAIVKPSLSAFELPGGANPLDGVDAGSFTRPALGDLDRDGDLDLVVAEYAGGFLYFENTAGALSPAFAARTGTSNPLDGQSAGILPSASLGDLDGDGDLDLVTGGNSGGFFYFENSGDATSPVFVQATGAANPLDGLDVGLQSTSALGDLDGDGDFDLVAGTLNGLFAYFENTGDATSPAFAERTGAANPLDGQDVGDRSVPALADLDRDGDLDLLAGRFDGALSLFENTGSAISPDFALRTGTSDPFDAEDLGDFSAPALGDLDGDGDPDVVASESFGGFRTFYLPEPGQGALLGAGVALLSWLERLRGRRGRER